MTTIAMKTKFTMATEICHDNSKIELKREIHSEAMALLTPQL